MLTIHSSRSRYETFLHCAREGFLQYCWGERGLVKEGKNMFLTTGTWLHYGTEQLARWLQTNKVKELPPDIVDNIVLKMQQGYFREVFELASGFDLSEETIDEWSKQPRQMTELEVQRLQQYTFNEQTALVEAFIRIAATHWFPQLLERFRIVTIEKEMSFPLTNGDGFEVIQSARIDLAIQEIETKDIYLVNYKGYRSFDARTAKAASHDTQGLSESWAFEQFLRGKGIDKRVMGVKMLYFVKGYRKETKRGSGNFEQASPLIRGWRRLGEDGPEYAYSWYYPKPDNDSGVGALGRSWDKFDVFQDEFSQEVGGVKGWMELLLSGQVQPELDGTEFGDVIGRQLVEPLPYGRHDRDLLSWERQAKAKEGEIARKLVDLKASEDHWAKQLAKGKNSAYSLFEFSNNNVDEEREVWLDENFPQTRASCHYPSDCSYISICHGTEEERTNPLNNGYVYRTPHHEAELVQLRTK